MPRTVRVSAPSRLHFGMFSFGHPNVRSYGGVGVMIAQPRLVLSVCAADRPEAHGSCADRALEFAQRFMAELPADCRFGYRIEIEAAPRSHIGLGSGTQLALAVGVALHRLANDETIGRRRLVELLGRAQRSAVGTHGFSHGGLIVEAGKRGGELGPLIERIALPDEWRIVLLMPQATEQGLSGSAEQQAFDKLSPVPLEVTGRLCQEVLLEMIPAAQTENFDAFGESLYRYGVEAGACFAAHQGGPFASPRLAELVAAIRDLGVRGVGQSSWGPTLFALLPDETQAQAFVRRLTEAGLSAGLELIAAAPDNHGARIEVIP